MLRRLTIILVCLLVGEAYAQQFEHYFADSTLRLDYSFAGNAKQVQVYPEELHMLPGWYGRRHHLDSLPLQGTGRITVRSQSDGRVLYRTSFSSLFQEWMSTEEAQRTSRSYENVYLVPFPKAPVTIDLELENLERQVVVRQRTHVDPADILIHHRGAEPPLPHEYLHRGGDSRACIDIAILAEGYTEAEMDKYMADARRAATELLRYEPFNTHRQSINIVAVKSPSLDSGVSVPRAASWRRTAFGAHFDTFYSERYLTSRRIKAIHEALVGIAYEHIIILANTEVYGGGGIYNSYTLSSIHPEHFLPVVVHEFGHSFGGLADEYFYDDDAMTDSYSQAVEPWEQNVTSLRDFEGKKWSSLIPQSTPIPTPVADRDRYPVGVYEGAAYSKRGMYRASYDCRMRTNTYPTFCKACHKALDELIRFYIGASK